MITVNEFFEEVKSLKKKAEVVESTYKNNEIWKEVNSKLFDIVKLIKSDKQMYRW